MRLIAFGPGLLVVLAVAAGCGPARAKVSGRVLFHGTPLPGGWVNFRPADPRQSPVSVPLSEQGRYEAVLPAGEVLVSIDNRQLQPRANLAEGLVGSLPLPPELRKDPEGARPEPDRPPSGEAEPPRATGKYVQVPDRYYNMDTSGLQFTATGTDQEHDFDLTD